MSSWLLRQMEDMVSALETIAPEQLREMPSYKIRLALRNELQNVGFDFTMAAKLAMRAKIAVTQAAFDNHRDLLDRMVTATARLCWISTSEIAKDFTQLSVEEIITFGEDISINLDM